MHSEHNDTSVLQKELVVLLVEDDPADQTLIEWAFTYSKRPYDLRVVSDGVDALDYVSRRGIFGDPSKSPRPDIILLDINMPRVEGMTVLEALKGHNDFRSIPVIMLTTSARESDMELSKRLGARCFWTKPKTRDEYIELVHVINCFLVERNEEA
ncbi:MAG: response regulator [Planctomycetes bacterium]|nr:response regulator [Planctomycetota bacterium]NUQ34192.1 response regulator [Planctomycetaceae bacterium]